MGSKRGRIYKRGDVYWIQYFFNGKDRRESTHSTKREVAEKLLTKRMAAKEAGTLSEASIKPLRFTDLRAAIERNYRLMERKSTDRMQDAFQALASKFAGWKTNAITETSLEEYVDERLAAGRKPATIVYEMRMLKRAYRLAKLTGPSFPTIAVNNIRKDFFEPEECRAVVDRLPAYLRPVMTAAYLMGWRAQSELLPLEWRDVNFKLGVVTLPIGSTKNGEGRTYPFGQFPELLTLFQARWKETEQLQRERGILIPWVFSRVTKKTVKPIKSYNTAWTNATKRAGVPGRWVHDFRRCGARALRDAAVPESVAMSLLGHKTPSMFKRYQITNNADLKAGVERLAAWRADQADYGTNHGTVTTLPLTKAKAQHG